MPKLYAHLSSDPSGGTFGFDQTTPQRWEVSNRQRPTCKYSFELVNCVSTAKFIASRRWFDVIDCSFKELEPFIIKD